MPICDNHLTSGWCCSHRALQRPPATAPPRPSPRPVQARAAAAGREGGPHSASADRLYLRHARHTPREFVRPHVPKKGLRTLKRWTRSACVHTGGFEPESERTREAALCIEMRLELCEAVMAAHALWHTRARSRAMSECGSHQPKARRVSTAILKPIYSLMTIYSIYWSSHQYMVNEQLERSSCRAKQVSVGGAEGLGARKLQLTLV